jgi:glycosyltransferase involved in cell wall biosynthesis
MKMALAKHDLPSEIPVSHAKISIGIVVFNGAEHIRNALDSIILQTYQNIELIVVDGGSEDGTQIILNEYAQHISLLVCEPDKGIYDAMNKVCTRATGDWLIFLGCDDVLLDAIGKVAAVLRRTDAVYYGDVIKRSSGKVYGGEFSKRRLMRCNICHQALFYPKSVFKKYSYSLDYQWSADYAYNLTLVGDGVPFVYTGIVVSIFNDEGRSSSGDIDLARDKLKLIRQTLGNGYALVEVLQRLRNRIGLRQRLLNCFPLHSCWKYLKPLWRSMRGSY